MVTTTHFLKNCIKVPKVLLLSPTEPQGVSAIEYNKILERQKIEAFKRGVMMFEDYNYDMYNKYILVDP